ncbi:MAG: hypothetical protein JW741_16855 [Sedimentisphaerales bacterium]|nr:hypothetical protein [Sedimentisphaerales bacterium]
MVRFCNLRDYLQGVSEEYPHYLVGRASEDAREIVPSWIVDVYRNRGDVILRYSEQGTQERGKAMSVEQFHRSVLSLSAKENEETQDEDVATCIERLCQSITSPLAWDDDSVELSSWGPESSFRADIPVCGAHLIHDKEVLAFLEPGQTS